MHHHVTLSPSAPADPAELARQVSIAVGSECPDCGSSHTEDNGETEYRCFQCDRRWGVERSGFQYGF